MRDKVHPVAQLFPMMAAEDLDALAADIKQRGLLHPIVLDREGQVLDGRNRLEACRRAGVEPAFEEYAGDDAAGYCLAVNIARRHMNKGQIAMVAARAWSQSDQRTVAKQAAVSKTRIAQAEAVLQFAPEVADQVVAGTVALNEAYATAQGRKAAAESHDALVAALRAEAPDLADLVAEERMTLGEGLAAAKERKAARQQRTQTNSSELARCVGYAAQVLPHAKGRASVIEYFDNAASRDPFEVDAASIMEAGKNLISLAEEWPK